MIDPDEIDWESLTPSEMDDLLDQMIEEERQQEEAAQRPSFGQPIFKFGYRPVSWQEAVRIAIGVGRIYNCKQRVFWDPYYGWDWQDIPHNVPRRVQYAR